MYPGKIAVPPGGGGIRKAILEFASLIGLLLYSIWSCLWLSIKALVV
jgi:hypothetical protein